MTAPPILELRNLAREFRLRSSSLLGRDRQTLRAVDGVTLSVPTGSSFGLAGESGSGKSTLARMLLLLDRPTEGAIVFEGRDLGSLDRQGVRWFRSRVQAVFQDATSSLSPRMRVRDIVAEPLESQGRAPTRREIDRRVAGLLEEVALPERAARAFPGQLSGGQRQRVAIARSLIVDPALIVLDEPVSALDVSIRGQVLNLLLDLRAERALTYVLIAHDLALLRHVTDRLAVMYRGRVVEEGGSEHVLSHPRHPYTRMLRAAVPGEPRERGRATVGSESATVVEGCRFRPRCAYAIERCAFVDPSLEPVGRDQSAACLRASEL